MASKIWTLMNPSETLHDVEWNMKPKPKGRASMLEETRQVHPIYSAVTSTKLPSCCIILKRRTKRRNAGFFSKF